MQLAYIARRFGVFLLIVWLAASLNFFLPKLSGQDPVRTKLLELAQLGGYVHAGLEDMVKEYDPALRSRQAAVAAISDVSARDDAAGFQLLDRQLSAHGARDGRRGGAVDGGASRHHDAAVVRYRHSAGRAAGAWPGAPRWMRWLMPPLWALHAIPFFLLGLILMYLLAFQVPLLPIFGGYSAGASPTLSLGFVWDVVSHALLPALSIVLVATGGWALGMRGMMVTTMGEDYVTFADAKGLKARPSLCVIACATRSCRRRPRWRWRWDRSCRARCWWRLSSGTRYRGAAVPGDTGERLFLDPGYCVHCDRGTGVGDVDPRCGLSVAGPEDFLSEG